MVIDWKKHIEACLAKGEFEEIFHQRARAYEYEHTLLTKRMLELGWEESQILRWFIEADSYLVTSIYDLEGDNGFLRKARHTKWPGESDYSIYVRQSEIDHIEGIRLGGQPLMQDEKKFLFGMVAFGKVMMKKRRRPVLNPADKSYVWYCLTGEDEYTYGKQVGPRMREFIDRLKKVGEIQLIHRGITRRIYTGRRGGGSQTFGVDYLKCDWVEWTTSGDDSDVVAIEDFEEDVKDVADSLFGKDIRICKQCGKEYEFNRKTKRDICEDCWKEKRNVGKNGKAPLKEIAICTKCGKEFEKTGRTKRTICLDCWKEKENIRKNGEGKASIEIPCTQCGNLFLKRPKTKRTLCDACYSSQRREKEKARLHSKYEENKQKSITQEKSGD